MVTVALTFMLIPSFSLVKTHAALLFLVDVCSRVNWTCKKKTPPTVAHLVFRFLYPSIAAAAAAACDRYSFFYHTLSRSLSYSLKLSPSHFSVVVFFSISNAFKFDVHINISHFYAQWMTTIYGYDMQLHIAYTRAPSRVQLNRFTELEFYAIVKICLR